MWPAEHSDELAVPRRSGATNDSWRFAPIAASRERARGWLRALAVAGAHALALSTLAVPRRQLARTSREAGAGATACLLRRGRSAVAGPVEDLVELAPQVEGRWIDALYDDETPRLLTRAATAEQRHTLLGPDAEVAFLRDVQR
jgi:hypothetical protein